jgi:hypothetical protein
MTHRTMISTISNMTGSGSTICPFQIGQTPSLSSETFGSGGDGGASKLWGKKAENSNEDSKDQDGEDCGVHLSRNV